MKPVFVCFAMVSILFRLGPVKRLGAESGLCQMITVWMCQESHPACRTPLALSAIMRPINRLNPLLRSACRNKMAAVQLNLRSARGLFAWTCVPSFSRYPTVTISQRGLKSCIYLSPLPFLVQFIFPELVSRNFSPLPMWRLRIEWNTEASLNTGR